MTKDQFAALHTGSEPLVLFNIWDAGSAHAAGRGGAKAIATGSAALAGAQGYDDGEMIPFDQLLNTVRQISGATKLPLTVDIESGYANDIPALIRNAEEILDVGGVGCNLEDRLIGGDGLRDLSEQADRISSISAAGLFVNARTDIFLAQLMAGENPNRAELVDAAIERADAYTKAGAGCFFAPGLSDPELISRLCGETHLPINIMRLPDMVTNTELAALGVARISYGPSPWRDAMAGVEEAARNSLRS